MRLTRLLQCACIIAAIAVIAVCYYIFADTLPRDIMWLNITVTAIVLILWIAGLLRRIYNSADPAQPQFATLGVRWTVITTYTVYALVGIAGMWYCHVDFVYQLLFHGIGWLLLLIGLTSSRYAHNQAIEIYHAQQSRLGGRASMADAARRLGDAAALAKVPEGILGRIAGFETAMRYITPCNTPVAIGYENDFVCAAQSLASMLQDPQVNEQQIGATLARLEIILKRRKECCL